MLLKRVLLLLEFLPFVSKFTVGVDSSLADFITSHTIHVNIYKLNHFKHSAPGSQSNKTFKYVYLTNTAFIAKHVKYVKIF